MTAAVAVPAGLPPIVCAPWCVDRNGHAGEIDPADQTCHGPGHTAITAAGEWGAHPVRDPNGQTWIEVWHEPAAGAGAAAVRLPVEVAAAVLTAGAAAAAEAVGDNRGWR